MSKLDDLIDDIADEVQGDRMTKELFLWEQRAKLERGWLREANHLTARQRRALPIRLGVIEADLKEIRRTRRRVRRAFYP